MRLSSTTFILFFNVLLAGTVSFMAGSLLSTWLHHQVLSIPVLSPRTFQIETAKLPVDSGKAQKEFAVILERNIFNAQKTEIELPPTLPEEEIIIEETTDGETVEHTRLAIALAGTMIYGEQNSFAFISKKDSLNKYLIYGIGECFHAKTIKRDEECAEESVKVLKIKDRWVLILYQGEKQALWMVSGDTSGKSALTATQPKKAKGQTASVQQTAAIVVPPQKNVVAEKAIIPASTTDTGNTYHFQRVWVDEQLAHFQHLLNDARVVPTTKDDKPYFMFQYIKEESIYEKLGLKKNDIILEINGFVVDSVGKALKLLEVLQSEREISLKVEREGNAVQFHYYID
jgi:type II secretion system protein C